MMEAVNVVFILAFFGGSVTADQLVFKTADPSSRMVTLGQEVTVHCEFRHGVVGKVTWLRDGQEIGLKQFSKGTDRVYETKRVDDEEVELHITEVRGEDAGNYTCRGETREGLFVYRHFFIQIFEPLVLEDCPKVQYPILGGSRQLISCWAQGDPAPTVTWSFGGSQLNITNSTKYEIDEETGGLYLLNVTEEDDGAYMMMAHTPTIVLRRTIAVESNLPPKITKFEDKYEGLAGKEIVLTCNVTGKPAPKVRWYRVEDGERSPIIPDDRVSISEEGNELHISDLYDTDAGVIECEAVNDMDHNHPDAKKTVLEVQFEAGGSAAQDRGKNTGSHHGTTGVCIMALASLPIAFYFRRH